MKILHTSDWHIGRRMKERERFDEFRKFFNWLEDLINREKIDVLLAAGDIFDNTTPSVQAQNIYYSFLSSLAKSECRHCVIISGNHDSAAFIDAPSELLNISNIHVVGQASQDPDGEIIILHEPDLIVCAVPYLRDRDVRASNLNDNFHEIESALKNGIKSHYREIFSRALEIRGGLNVPIIAMGHLFAQKGSVRLGEGIRPLYVGTAAEIESKIFPEYLAYTALGHLHSPQFIERENIRYSGSPIAMTFAEALTRKSVTLIDIDDKTGKININEIPVPVFQKLARAIGDDGKIFAELENLAAQSKPGESVWIEITYTGNDLIENFREKLDEFIQKFPELEIVTVYDERAGNLSLEAAPNMVTQGLDNITPLEMLNKCFDENNVAEEQRGIFIRLYNEILQELDGEF